MMYKKERDQSEVYAEKSMRRSNGLEKKRDKMVLDKFITIKKRRRGSVKF